MTNASGCDVELIVESLPILDGSLEQVSAGILSSLQPQNTRLRRAIMNIDQWHAHPKYPLLLDPQTAGGLLASVSEDKAQSCLEELAAEGCSASVAVGRVKQRGTEDAAITLV